MNSMNCSHCYYSVYYLFTGFKVKECCRIHYHVKEFSFLIKFNLLLYEILPLSGIQSVYLIIIDQKTHLFIKNFSSFNFLLIIVIDPT